MDRKDLLLGEASEGEMTPEEEKKLRRAEEDGRLYLSLFENLGWKHLMKNYIDKRISQERYLTASSDDLADIRAAQRELYEMLQFVNQRISEGQNAYKKLTSSK